MALRVALTGHVGIEAAEGFVDTAGLGRLGRTAFAYLVSERQRPVPRDELAEVLWGEELPRTWETSLRVVVSKLRTWLEGAGLNRAEALTSAFGTYQLHLPPETVVDVEQVAAALAKAESLAAAGDPAAALPAAAVAAGAAAAEFLPGASGAWVERRQDELRTIRLAALELAASAALASGDGPAALAAAEDAVALQPLHESAHLLVMRAHDANGNRAEALRAYERLRLMLTEELGVSPSPATEAAYLAVLRDEPVAASPPPAAAAPAPAPLRLPSGLSSFVGREAELAEVKALVATGRCLTIAGTGGLGKTRLALEAARTLGSGPDFPDGAAFVPLGEIADPGAVPSYTLAVLGLVEEPGRTPLASLVDALAGRRMVLVLDNCEHVVGAAATQVAALLTSAPGLAVLATAREPLGVPGEVVWRAPTMALEEAGRLFVERAAAASPGFVPGPAEQARLDEICRRLDGIPLAIELAAARADVLSVAEIADRLDDRFRLLTGGARTAPPRQQTLRGAVDWSHDNLPLPERDLLHRLSVFPGPFTLAAAGRVAGADLADVLDLLSSLVRRSLVVVVGRDGSGQTRYRLLETIRAYAAEKLAASGEDGAARAALLRWAVELAEEAEPHLDGPDQAAWLHRLDADHANLRAALAVDPAGDEALRLATALGRFWEVRGYLAEGRQALRDVLSGNEDGPPLLRARAHNAAALLAQRQGDYAAARSRLEESLAIRRGHGDRLGTAVALHGLGNLAALQHDLPAARKLYEEALAVGRELGDQSLTAAALDNLGWVAHVSADFDAAQEHYEEALAVQRSLGDARSVALVLGQLGDLAYQQGDYSAAASRHEESLELRTALGDRAGRADSLATLGHLAMHDGRLDVARAHLEESLAIRRDVGDRAALPSALTNVGDLALASGDLGAARKSLEEAAAVARAGRDRVALGHVLVHYGRVARLEGKVGEAVQLYAESARAGALGPDAVTAEWLEGVGATVAAAGNADLGARLVGAADALRETLGAPVPPHERPARDRDVEAVRAALGDDRFTAAWDAGRAMPLADALAEARSALD